MTLPRLRWWGRDNGHGIAYVAALAGCEVALHDSRADALPQARAKIDELLAGRQARKVTAEESARVAGRCRWSACSTTPSRAPAWSSRRRGRPRRETASPVRNRAAAPKDALLASNTSSFSIGQLAAALEQPGRLVGMHFFNPVH